MLDEISEQGSVCTSEVGNFAKIFAKGLCKGTFYLHFLTKLFLHFSCKNKIKVVNLHIENKRDTKLVFKQVNFSN